MLKFATFEIQSAVLVPRNAGAKRMARIRRQAHRHEFDYEPRKGFLYVRSRAISSRTNDNYDEFPAEEIKTSYKTFIGKPVFVNHVNDDHKRARGVIIDAALHEDRLADGAPDTWAEVLMEVDAIRFPKLAEAILSGRIDRTSMGCDVAYSICSACGNKATTPAEYCNHIPRLKGKKILQRNAATGKQEEHLIRETCYGLKFFENSLLVEPPADPTAFFLGVDDRGLRAAAMKRVTDEHGREVWTTETKDTDPLDTSQCTSRRDNPTFCRWHKTDHLETNGEPRGDVDGHMRPVGFTEPPRCDFCGGFHDSLSHYHHTEPEVGAAKREDDSALDGIPLDDAPPSGDQGPAGGPFFGGPGYRYINPKQGSQGDDNDYDELNEPCGPCSLYPDEHTYHEHFERNTARGLDPWGRKIMQPYDGYDAWSCNNYGCSEHPKEMYDHVPGRMPGWLIHDADPTAKAINQVFHERGLDEGRDLLDQQHTGPTKYSVLWGEDGGPGGVARPENMSLDDLALWTSNGGRPIGESEYHDAEQQRISDYESLRGHDRSLSPGEQHALNKGSGPTKYSSLTDWWKSQPDLASAPAPVTCMNPDSGCKHDLSRHYNNGQGRIVCSGCDCAQDIPKTASKNSSRDPDQMRDPDAGSHPHNHTFLGDEDQPCADCGEDASDHPHLHTGQWTRCSTPGCGRDMGHWLHEPGRHEFLQAKRSQMPMDDEAKREQVRRLFEDYGTPYLDANEQGLENQLRGLSGDEQDLFRQQPGKPTKYSKIAGLDRDDPSALHAAVAPGHPQTPTMCNRRGPQYRFTDDESKVTCEHCQNEIANDKPCTHPWCVKNEPEHTVGEHNMAPPAHLDPYSDESQEAERKMQEVFGDHPLSFLLEQNEREDGTNGPTKYSSLMRFFAEKAEQPTVSGVVLKAADTGRILMLQRSLSDEKDPAAGTWEFPGGHHEDGDDTSLHAGIREWEEEVGQPFPSGGTVSHVWRSPNGIYQGHVVVIPSEDAVDLSKGRAVGNPDDPDGDDSEQVAWWDPKHAEANPALRREVKKAPWDAIRKAASQSADGWVTCDQGHQHWGGAGAAGLLIRHTDPEGNRHYLLQHRAPWVQEGGTWSTPSGALRHGESSYDGVKREAAEEMGGLPEQMTHVGEYTDDHGGWRFTTHVVEVPEKWTPNFHDTEIGTEGHRWVPEPEVGSMPLHSGFAKTWPTLSKAAAKGLPKTQKCEYCKEPATQRLLWAEGMAYIPACDKHHDKARHRIEVTNHDEVVSVQKVGSTQDDGDDGPHILGPTHMPGSGDVIKTNEICPECGKPKDHIHISPEAQDEMRAAAEAGQMRGEMHDHAQKRTINLNDHNDLKAHLVEAHGYDPDWDFFVGSHDADHPALDDDGEDDRQMHPHEVRRMHDWEHGHGIRNDNPDYRGGEPGTFLGDEHFHTASATVNEDEIHDVDRTPEGKCHYYPDHDHEHEHDKYECEACRPGAEYSKGQKHEKSCPFATQHTDWDWAYPQLGKEIHRGMTLPDVGEHGNLRDRVERAVDHLDDEGHVGHFWTPYKETARQFGGAYGDHGQQGVIFHIARPKREDIETNPWQLKDDEVAGFGMGHGEVPLKRRTRLDLRGISLQKSDEHSRTHPEDPKSWKRYNLKDKDYYGDDSLGAIWRTSMHRVVRKTAGARDIWPVRVKIKDRSTGRYTGTHLGNPRSVHRMKVEQSPRDQWPFRLCEDHLSEVKRDIADHNTNRTDHPHTFEVEHDTWPLDPTDKRDVSACDACITNSVNRAFAVRKTALSPHFPHCIVCGDEMRVNPKSTDYQGNPLWNEGWYHADGMKRDHAPRPHDDRSADDQRAMDRAQMDQARMRVREQMGRAFDQIGLGKAVDEATGLFRESSWIGDYSDEPSLFWRAPKTKQWEVHIHDHMPDRELREQYGAKPHQYVTLYHADQKAAPAPGWTKPRGGWDYEPKHNRFVPNAWGAVARGIPAHVMNQVYNAQNEVDKHAQDHADLYGQLAEHKDIEDDLRQAPADMEKDERGRRMFRNLLNAAGESTCTHCDGEGNTERGPKTCTHCDGHGFLKEASAGRLYWRAHPDERPFSVEDAKSQEWGYQGERYPHALGYSAFSDPSDLFGYFHPSERIPDNGSHVVSFTGHQVGTGPDSEPLVVPDMKHVQHHDWDDVADLVGRSKIADIERRNGWNEWHDSDDARIFRNGLRRMVAGLTRHEVQATEVLAGDYLDSNGKTRVHNVLTRSDKTMLAYKVRGSKSPGIRVHQPEETVNVWRRPSKTAAKGDDRLPGGYLMTHSNPQTYWAKPTGEAPYDAIMAAHGFESKQEGHGPWHIIRHPETRAYHLIDNQGRSVGNGYRDPGVASYEHHDPTSERLVEDAWMKVNQEHGHIPHWEDREGNPAGFTGMGSAGQRGGGYRLHGTEHATGTWEGGGHVDQQHAVFHAPPPPIEHTTEDPRWEGYRQRAKDNPAPKVYPAKTVQQSSSREHGSTYRQVQHGEPGYNDPGAFHDPSPDEEWHGPYGVIQHPDTGKYHVVDNQNRITRAGPRDGMDDQASAEERRDYIDGRMMSKEKARGMVERLWGGAMEAMDPGGTDESRKSERHTKSMTDLMDRYNDGAHHPLHPGKFGYDDEDEKGDQNGQPYYEVKDPGGSGWKARDYGGPNVHIYHDATGDEAHDLIDAGDPAHENQMSRPKPKGYGHDEIHQELHHWIHGDPSQPEDERWAAGKDYARNDPRIERWQRRKGYQG